MLWRNVLAVYLFLNRKNRHFLFTFTALSEDRHLMIPTYPAIRRGKSRFHLRCSVTCKRVNWAEELKRSWPFSDHYRPLMFKQACPSLLRRKMHYNRPGHTKSKATHLRNRFIIISHIVHENKSLTSPAALLPYNPHLEPSIGRRANYTAGWRSMGNLFCRCNQGSVTPLPYSRRAGTRRALVGRAGGSRAVS